GALQSCVTGAAKGGPEARSTLHLLRLGEAEAVAARILEDRLDTVEHFFGRPEELDALGGELLMGLAAVGGFEHAGSAEFTAGQQGAELGGGFRIVAAVGADFHQDELKIGLAFGAYSEPAKSAEFLIHAELEAQFLDVEFAGSILVRDVQG